MRKLYKMRCKNKNCKVEGGYQYYYEGESYEYERCPICGYGAPFLEFVERIIREIKTSYNTR